jgi:hypothetical protein
MRLVLNRTDLLHLFMGGELQTPDGTQIVMDDIGVVQLESLVMTTHRAAIAGEYRLGEVREVKEREA